MNGMPNEVAPIAAVLAPITMANSEKTTGAAEIAQCDAWRAVLMTGDMAAETIDFRIEAADDSGFSTNKTTIVAATQLAAHASNNDNKLIVLEAKSSDIRRIASTAKYVRARGITGGATGGPCAMVLEGMTARKQAPTNIAAIAEVKRP